MTGTDLATIREEQQQALDRGDNRAANDAYARELQALAGDGTAPAPAAAAPTLPAEKADAVFDSLAAQHDPELVAKLRQEWGDKAGENLLFARALATDHPELGRIVERYGVGDHPAWLAAANYIARQSGYTFGDGAGAAPAPGGDTGMSDEAFAEGNRDFIRRIELAQSEGNSRLANQIYQQQQEWIGKVRGNAPIVGSGGRRA